MQVQLRRDPTVVLNGVSSSSYSGDAAPLNRFVTFLLNECEPMEYLRGELKRIRFCEQHLKYEVTIEGQPEPLYFDEVIVRHGPHQMLESITPPGALKDLQARWKALADDRTITRAWGNFYPRGYSEHAEKRPRAQRLMSLSLREYVAAISRILSSAGATIRWVSDTSSEPSSDQIGFDAELVYRERSYPIEVKARSLPVRSEDVLQLEHRLRGPGPSLIIISSSGYTSKAKEVARRLSVKLWENQDLLEIQDSREIREELLPK